MALKYTTTQQLAKTLSIKSDVPSWDVGNTPAREIVGTGNNSETIFYLNQRNILADSYTLSAGGTATLTSSATALTETTEYSIDKDSGKITLTGTGLTTVGTDFLLAEYSYLNVDVTDSHINDILSRAEAQIDSTLNTSFTDGSTSNPRYPTFIEIQPSKGRFDKIYRVDRKPLIDISFDLAGPLGTTGTTAGVDTSGGTSFPSEGTIIINNEIITYTGVSGNSLTGLTRGVDNSTAAPHVKGDEIHTTVVEVSATEQGSEPVYNALKWNDEVFVTENGKVYINNTSIIANVAADDAVHPRQDIENRFKIRYLHGHKTIPSDITRLALIYAKRILSSDTVSKALFSGRNEFSPDIFDADETERQRIEGTYKVIPMDNT